MAAPGVQLFTQLTHFVDEPLPSTQLWISSASLLRFAADSREPLSSSNAQRFQLSLLIGSQPPTTVHQCFWTKATEIDNILPARWQSKRNESLNCLNFAGLPPV